MTLRNVTCRACCRVLAIIFLMLVAVGAAAAGDGGAIDVSGKIRHPHRAAELLVVFAPEVTAAERAALRDRCGAELLAGLESIHLERWRLPAATDLEAVRDALTREPGVETVELNYLYRPQALPDDPYFNRQRYLGGEVPPSVSGVASPGTIGAPAAWELETGSPAMVIAVIDSGVAFDHPDLAGNIWTNPGEIPDNGRDDDGNGYVDDIHGWDFVNGDANPSDYSRDLYGNGHGTHVAGIIAARGDNGRGVVGVMWQAAIMPLQIFDIYESDSYRDAVIQSFNIIAAIRYAVDNGARIVNCSFGGPAYSVIQENALRDAHEAGVLVVAAAGNDGRDNDLEPTYPAAYDLPNIIAVAATDDHDELASYSNYGTRSVDVAAPGGSSGDRIYSTLPPARVPIFSDDFEAGADAWRTWSRWEDWSLGYDSWGSRVVQDSAGTYHNNELSCIESAALIDTTGYRGVLFRFLVDYELEDDFDYFSMALSWADGDREEVGAITGKSFGWVEYLAWSNDEDLGRFHLEFCLRSDSSRTFAGVQLDDIEVTGIRWEYEGSEYGYKQGTSMATPVVSGVAGLVWAARPGLAHLDVIRMISENVDPVPSLAGKVFAGGRVNAWRTLAAAAAIPVEPVVPADGTVPNGSPATVAVPAKLIAGAPLVDPAAVTVRVAAGPVSVAPRLRAADCAAAERPLLYVRIIGTEPEFGDLTPLVTGRCTAGVLTIDLGTVDLGGLPGTYDLFYGYAIATGEIYYNAYRLVAE